MFSTVSWIWMLLRGRTRQRVWAWFQRRAPVSLQTLFFSITFSELIEPWVHQANHHSTAICYYRVIDYICIVWRCRLQCWTYLTRLITHYCAQSLVGYKCRCCIFCLSEELNAYTLLLLFLVCHIWNDLQKQINYSNLFYYTPLHKTAKPKWTCAVFLHL